MVFKGKNGSKTEFHRNGLWRRSARISRKDKIRNTVIKQKMNVERSLLDQTTSMVWTGPKNGRGKIAERSYEMTSTGKKKTRQT
jgi:hypothetical protein